MFKRRTFMLHNLAAFLILSCAVNQPLMAMGSFAADQVVTGTVQNIDYLHHSITVNGQTYAVSPKAQFHGIGGFSVLHIGMPIRFMLGGATPDRGPSIPPVFRGIGKPPGSQAPGTSPPARTASPPPVIIDITWLPAAP